MNCINKRVKCVSYCFVAFDSLRHLRVCRKLKVVLCLFRVPIVVFGDGSCFVVQSNICFYGFELVLLFKLCDVNVNETFSILLSWKDASLLFSSLLIATSNCQSSSSSPAAADDDDP